jgi:small-conductance mechanosensitive channel
MMLGWSLQAPVTGIAAWLMIILKRTFKLGDRIIIAGIIGEVTDITLTHIILNQVGGTIGGEEKSGRGVLIPNATMFGQIIYNYTLETTYILDEVVVRITYDSDWDTVERILLAAAREVTKDIIEETGQEAFIRSEFFDAGVHIRLRYQSIPSERQRMSSDIVKIIFHEFAKTDKAHFCYPHSEVIYQWKEGAAQPPVARLPYPGKERIEGKAIAG